MWCHVSWVSTYSWILVACDTTYAKSNHAFIIPSMAFLAKTKTFIDNLRTMNRRDIKTFTMRPFTAMAGHTVSADRRTADL
jgi:hypothetical protein